MCWECSFAVSAAKLAERGERVVASVLTVIWGRLPLLPLRCTLAAESLVEVAVEVEACSKCSRALMASDSASASVPG